MSAITSRKSNTRSLKIVRKAQKRLVRLSAKARKTAAPARRELTDLDRENMVLEHRESATKMARSILRRWRARLEYNELGSIIDLSLCEAVKNFNPEKGAAFATFLFYHLRGNLIKAVQASISSRSFAYLEDLFVAHSEENESAAILETDMADAFSGEGQVLPDEMLFRKEMVRFARASCDRLDPLAKEVVERAFDCEEQLMKIADDVGYSRCHVSRVKRRALAGMLEELAEIRGDNNSFTEVLGDSERVASPRRAVRRRAHGQERVKVQQQAENEAESTATGTKLEHY